MKIAELKKEIESLPLSEKILLVEDLWDSIAKSQNKIELRKWQKEELIRRYDKYEKGDLELSDCEKVHNELRSKAE